MSHQSNKNRANITWFTPQSQEEQKEKEDDESSSDETPDEVEIL